MNSTCKNQERKQVKIKMMHKKIKYNFFKKYTPWFAIDKDDHFLFYNFIINGEAISKLVKSFGNPKKFQFSSNYEFL